MIESAREVNNGVEKPESAHIFLTHLNECENSLSPRAFPAPSADETANIRQQHLQSHTPQKLHKNLSLYYYKMHRYISAQRETK